MEDDMSIRTLQFALLGSLTLVTACQTAEVHDTATVAAERSQSAPHELRLDEDPHAWVERDAALVDEHLRAVAEPQLRGGEQVIHAMQRTLKYTGQDVVRLVLFDPETGETRKVDVDLDGRPLDLAAAHEANLDIARDLFGDLSEELATTLEGMEPSQKVAVEVWYDAPAPPARPDPSDDMGALALDREREEYGAVLSQARAALVSDLLASGGELLFEAQAAPIIEVELEAGVVLDQLWDRRDVTGVHFSRADEPMIPTSAVSSQDMNLEQFHTLNHYGMDVRVGLLEACSDCGVWGEIWADNANLWFDITERSAPRSCTVDADCATLNDDFPECVDGECMGWHPTTVAGMVGMLPDLFHPAGAPIVDLYVATGSGSHAQKLDWQVGQGVRVSNESWIGSYTNPNAQDYYVRNWGMSLTRAAGNGGQFASSSCAASNHLCVGGYDPSGTADVWTDDGIWGGASTANPADCPGPSPGYGCDREVPDLVGHATGVTSTTCDDLDADGLQSGLSGTSFAAPAIAGTVALMADRNAMMEYYPEVVRAILMTSADHDVHTPVAGRTFSDYHAPDERDGAGVPNATHIVSIMHDSQFVAGSYTPAEFDASDRMVLATVEVTQPDTTIRAVAAWSSCPSGHAVVGPTAIATDFDLHILNPNGHNVANGASYDGPHEIVEVVATDTGTYTFELQYFSWNNCYGQQQEYVGFAYDLR